MSVQVLSKTLHWNHRRKWRNVKESNGRSCDRSQEATGCSCFYGSKQTISWECEFPNVEGARLPLESNTCSRGAA